MYKIVRFFSLIFLLGTMLSFSQTTLGYHLKKGEAFNIKQTAHQVMVQSMEGTSHEITNDLEGIYEFKVTNVDQNNYGITLQFKDFALKSTSSLQGTLMDVRASEPVEGDIVSNMFSTLIGHEMGMKMDKQGKVLSIDGGDELVEKMINSVPGIDDFTKNIMKKSLEKEFSSDGLARSFEQMTYFYPTEPKNIGDTWEAAFSGKVNSINQWKLEKVEGDVLSISGNADVTMENAEQALTLSLNGHQETLIQASAKNGFIIKLMVSGKNEGKSIMAHNNMEIPTTLDQTITYELITE
ncbi:DUF6263 family protein [Flagellimonas onchidii]|uniref:DUF6263 family protein n=1 Tax=Flagellimonas onchidii TaxID=2562684 RepID=UPI0010A6793C|nr:DUF6263 family protein [Allomuricauda onchidii]